MLRLAILLSLWLSACAAPALEPQNSSNAKRIVSLDYCADQYLLELVGRERILALSPDAEKSFSYHRDRARGIAQVRPVLEDILGLQPDLVIRTYAGDAGMIAALHKAGIETISVGWTPDLKSIRRVTVDVATQLGEPERGEALIEVFDQRLEAITPREEASTALYMTPYGVTTGPGSLVHEMIEVAGLNNFQTRTGWHSLPLERLAYDQPDLVIAAFFEASASFQTTWSAARHPIAQAQLSEQTSLSLQGAWTSCGSWYLIDAIEALAEGKAHVD